MTTWLLDLAVKGTLTTVSCPQQQRMLLAYNAPPQEAATP